MHVSCKSCSLAQLQSHSALPERKVSTTVYQTLTTCQVSFSPLSPEKACVVLRVVLMLLWSICFDLLPSVVTNSSALQKAALFFSGVLSCWHMESSSGPSGSGFLWLLFLYCSGTPSFVLQPDGMMCKSDGMRF